VVHAHPRSARFKEDVIQAFYDATSTSRRRPSANVNCRRARGQGSALPSPQFLQRHPGIRWARVSPATRAIESKITEAIPNVGRTGRFDDENAI